MFGILMAEVSATVNSTGHSMNIIELFAKTDGKTLILLHSYLYIFCSILI